MQSDLVVIVDILFYHLLCLELAVEAVSGQLLDRLDASFNERVLFGRVRMDPHMADFDEGQIPLELTADEGRAIVGLNDRVPGPSRLGQGPFDLERDGMGVNEPRQRPMDDISRVFVYDYS